MWQEFGFSKNLYDTHPIKGDSQGERLLVGRETELEQIKNRLTNINSVVTLEGPNGVGKTSLVLVAGFQLERQTMHLGKRSLILQPNPLLWSSNERYTRK
jgi:predicted AAA+ superfamily ATPase